MTDAILFSELPGQGGALGMVTLNRPDALNSLNLDMIRALHAQLQIWALAPGIKAVVIAAAAGRAFSAGGDLRATYAAHQARDANLAYIFKDEYQLNQCIFHYPKPYIALLDGITMGGGVGIAIHGSHRVATDRLLFAMPETGIGFFPDVGGTYFLPRLPGLIGYYLGLVGTQLKSDDCVALGLAQSKVLRTDLLDLVEQIAQADFALDARATVSNVIAQFQVAAESSTLLAQQHDIDTCFANDTIENIMIALQQGEHGLCQEAALAMTKKSPTSLKVTLRALRLGANMGFDACMRQEYNLAMHFIAGHDFIEGIRAIIIDKDQKPRWQPANLADVFEQKVEQYFLPINL